MWCVSYTMSSSAIGYLWAGQTTATVIATGWFVWLVWLQQMRLSSHCHNKHSKAERLFAYKWQPEVLCDSRAHSAGTHTHIHTHAHPHVYRVETLADGRHVDRWKLRRFTFQNRLHSAQVILFFFLLYSFGYVFFYSLKVQLMHTLALKLFRNLLRQPSKH